MPSAISSRTAGLVSVAPASGFCSVTTSTSECCSKAVARADVLSRTSRGAGPVPHAATPMLAAGQFWPRESLRRVVPHAPRPDALQPSAGAGQPAFWEGKRGNGSIKPLIRHMRRHVTVSLQGTDGSAPEGSVAPPPSSTLRRTFPLLATLLLSLVVWAGLASAEDRAMSARFQEARGQTRGEILDRTGRPL